MNARRPASGSMQSECSKHGNENGSRQLAPTGAAKEITLSLAATVTDEEFRACGYTSAARNYPLSNAAFFLKCRFNGADPDRVPRAWMFAPNEYMLRYWELEAGTKMTPRQDATVDSVG